MSVNFPILAGGFVAAASVFFTGRYLAALTPEKAAEMKQHNPRLESLDTLHRFGKIVMLSAPVVFGLAAYVAFTTGNQ